MNGPMSRPNNAAAIRGALLVVVAVVVGIYLLRGTDTPTLDTAPSASPTTVQTSESEVSAEADGGESSTETTLPGISVATTNPETASDADDSDAGTMVGFEGRPNAEVSVQVANSTSVRGAAGRTTDVLKTKGFITKSPMNMKGTALDRTRVHYKPGNIIEAGNIAILLGLDDKNDVYKMPQDLSAFGDFEDPHILIALGIDKASAE
ncbi:MAG: hypothetical protein MB55_09150 [marine actinobacterium MedAcidi-G3]|nr:MAG: hypothetical protein MB55_09150 [marine actinobacterium MedAcidi-G3]MBA4813582.1 LytR C-terminal domain-containing protein [Acidimicrobiales bacterium]OUW87356.1 MAG: hypothetical protein CBD84_02010 [Acidimicrobiaceae bacterium TMED224]HBQ03939.1 LytR family transcriptional regulator [Acidimicrobiaceae bacterium]|tara:strand:- start:535 stop:1155 length:621 start_codon:yes stop_codon:yes gene_type:complete